MHKLRNCAIVVAILALAGSVAMAASPALLSSPAVLNDVSNNSAYETDGLPRSGPQPSPQDAFTYTVEWAFGVGQIGCVGVTPVQDTLVWVSSGGVTGGNTDSNWVLVFDARTRTQVESFPEYVQAASLWGYRDMYYDQADNAVYAGYESNKMDKINATTHALIATYTLTGSPTPGLVRGLTGDGDSLYVSQFASTIIKCSKTGTNCHTVAPAAHAGIYGLACARSEGQVYGSTASYDYSCVRYNFPVWSINDTTLLTQITGGTMGGCEMFRNDTFLVVLGQMAQDSVFCLRRRAGVAADVGVDAIRAPTASVDPGAVITPTAHVRNFGSSAQVDVPVTCWIDSAGTRVYTGTATIGSLPGDDTARVTFTPPTWTAGPGGASYQVTMFTSLSGDANQANDTARQSTFCFQVLDTLVAPFKTVAVTLDGDIQTAEWADAEWYDVSDVLGMEGPVRPAGSAFLYVKHDSTTVYWAMDLPNYASQVDYDQFGCYLDENYDRAWATDSSEGNHWFAYLGGVDTTLYRSVPYYVIRWQSGNGSCASSLTSGHFQYEASVSKGAQHWNYTILPEADTVGFYCYAAVTGGVDYQGHWPTTMPGTSWNDPTQYGTLIFLAKGASAVHDVGRQALPVPFSFTIVPNPFASATTISYSLPNAGNVNLKLYDVTGKLLTTLATGYHKAGTSAVTVSRSSLASGVYLLRLETDNSTATSKLIVE
jgi:hypothetical protein